MYSGCFCGNEIEIYVTLIGCVTAQYDVDGCIVMFGAASKIYLHIKALSSLSSLLNT